MATPEKGDLACPPPEEPAGPAAGGTVPDELQERITREIAEERKAREGAEEKGKEKGKERKHGWRRWLLWIILAIIVIVGGYFGIRAYLFARVHESTDDAFVSGHLVPILARVAAFTDNVFVQNTEPVKEGESLVHLEEHDLRNALAEAEAAVVQARAEAAGRPARPGQAQAALLQAERQQVAAGAQVASTRAAAVLAARNFERAEELVVQEIISLQAFDSARTAVATTRAALAMAEAQLEAAQAAVINARAGLQSAEARLQSALAALKQARLNLSYTRITAPVNGTVDQRTVNPGQFVEVGQPLMAVVADTGMWLTANFKETQVARIRPGQPVTFSVDAYKGCKPEGVVVNLAGASGAEFAILPPQNATGNFIKIVQRIPVRINVTRGCGKEHPLRPGMSVNVHVLVR